MVSYTEGVMQNAPMISLGLAPAGRADLKNIHDQIFQAVLVRHGLGYYRMMPALGRFRLLDEVASQLDISIDVSSAMGQASWDQVNGYFLSEANFKLWVSGKGASQPVVRGLAALLGQGGLQEGVGIRWPGGPITTSGYILRKSNGEEWDQNEVQLLSEACHTYRMNFDTSYHWKEIEFWNYDGVETERWGQAVGMVLNRFQEELHGVPLSYILTPLDACMELIREHTYAFHIACLGLAPKQEAALLQKIRAAFDP